MAHTDDAAAADPADLQARVLEVVRGLAAETGGVAYFVKNVEDLNRIYEQLEKELRTQYLIGYYTESSRTDRNYRTVEVRTNRKEAKVRTVRGFIP